VFFLPLPLSQVRIPQGGSRGSVVEGVVLLTLTPTNRKVACVLFSPYCKVACLFVFVFLLLSQVRIPQGGSRGSVVEKVIGAMRNVVNAAQLQLAEEGELRRRWVDH